MGTNKQTHTQTIALVEGYLQNIKYAGRSVGGGAYSKPNLLRGKSRVENLFKVHVCDTLKIKVFPWS